MNWHAGTYSLCNGSRNEQCLNERVKRMTDDEKKAIKLCLAGDSDAFELLVNRYESAAKALAWNITGSPEAAMEVVQETFLQAFKNLHRFDPEKDFKKWLLGIAAKRGIDHIRKKKRFLNFFNLYAEETSLAEEDKRRIEDSPIFHPLLKRLSERERVVLSLQMNENYSAAEIGSILDCSENSVRVLQFKARKKLKKALMTQGFASIPNGAQEVAP